MKYVPENSRADLIGSGGLVKSINAASFVLFVCLCVFISACSPGETQIKFREEISLADGQKLIAERLLDVRMLGEIGGPGGWEPIHQSLEIVAPKPIGGPPKWESSEALTPVLLDRSPGDGQWTLLVTFQMCKPWIEYGRPKIPYAEFQVRDGQWRRVEFSPVWLGRKTNVFIGMNASGQKPMVSLADKERENADPAVARWYVQIEDHFRTGC